MLAVPNLRELRTVAQLLERFECEVGPNIEHARSAIVADDGQRAAEGPGDACNPHRSSPRSTERISLAEEKGFEPLVTCATAVLKAAPRGPHVNQR